MSSHRARLIEKTYLSPDIADFRFQILDGHIACLEPGAHVDVRLAPDLVRQYSLWNWDPEGRWFNIAVKREPGGRGGSLAMHKLSVGDEVEIGGPRSHFALAEATSHITLIAGGIGVTPILAMVRELHASGADFRVFYLVRSQDNAAMDDLVTVRKCVRQLHRVALGPVELPGQEDVTDAHVGPARDVPWALVGLRPSAEVAAQRPSGSQK